MTPHLNIPGSSLTWTRYSPKSSTSLLHWMVIIADQTPLADIQGNTRLLDHSAQLFAARWAGILLDGREFSIERGKGYLCWTGGSLLSTVPELMIHITRTGESIDTAD